MTSNVMIRSKSIYYSIVIKTIFYYLLLSVTSIAWASNVFEDIADSNGVMTWRIVSRVDEQLINLDKLTNKTDAGPGIYGRGSQSNFDELLIPGDILINRKTSNMSFVNFANGVNGRSGRMAGRLAFAIVDGKLSFFEYEENNHVIINSFQKVDGHEIAMPQIERIEDFNIIMVGMNKVEGRNSYHFYTSLKLDNPIQGTTGLSVAIHLIVNKDGKLELFETPRLIDYYFYQDSSQLEQLINRDKDYEPIFDKVYSVEKLKEHVQDDRYSDHPLFAKYINGIKKGLEDGYFSRKDTPTYNYSKGKLETLDFLTEKINFNHALSDKSIGTITLEIMEAFGNSKASSFKITNTGRINELMHSEVGQIRFYPLDGDHQYESYIADKVKITDHFVHSATGPFGMFFVEDTFFLYGVDGSYGIRYIKRAREQNNISRHDKATLKTDFIQNVFFIDNELPVQITSSAIKGKRNTEELRWYLAVSAKYKKEEYNHTRIFEIFYDDPDDKSFDIARTYIVKEHFYTQEQLSIMFTEFLDIVAFNLDLEPNDFNRRHLRYYKNQMSTYTYLNIEKVSEYEDKPQEVIIKDIPYDMIDEDLQLARFNFPKKYEHKNGIYTYYSDPITKSIVPKHLISNMNIARMCRSNESLNIKIENEKMRYKIFPVVEEKASNENGIKEATTSEEAKIMMIGIPKEIDELNSNSINYWMSNVSFRPNQLKEIRAMILSQSDLKKDGNYGSQQIQLSVNIYELDDDELLTINTFNIENNLDYNLDSKRKIKGPEFASLYSNKHDTNTVALAKIGVSWSDFKDSISEGYDLKDDGFLQGRYLLPSSINRDEDSKKLNCYALLSKTYKGKRGKSYEISVYAIDTKYKEGEDGFFFLIEVENIEPSIRINDELEDALPRKNVVKYKPILVPVSFKNLQGLHFFSGDKKSKAKGHFALHYSFFDPSRPSHSSNREYVASFEFREQFDKKNEQVLVDFDPFYNPQVKIAKKINSLDKLTDFSTDINMDEDGHIFLSLDSFSNKNKKHEVYDIFRNKTCNPVADRLSLKKIETNFNFSWERYFQKLPSWRVKKGGVRNDYLPTIFGDMNQNQDNRTQNDIFKEWNEILEDVGTTSIDSIIERSPKHQAVIAPEKLKNYIMKSMVGKWLSTRNHGQNWSHMNEDLHLYFLNEGKKILDHEEIRNNFDAMREDVEENHKKVILIVDIAKALKEPQAIDTGDIDDPYYISVPRFENYYNEYIDTASPIKSDDSPNPYNNDDELSEMKKEKASIAYILASEGNVMSIEEHKNFGKENYEFDILLIGTQEEYDKFIKMGHIRENNFVLSEHFEQIHLKMPTEEDRSQYIIEFLENRMKSFTKVEVDGKGCFQSKKESQLSREEKIKKIVEDAIVRTEGIGLDQGDDSFTSFVYLLSKIDSYLGPEFIKENNGLLRIDKHLFTNVLSGIYNMPLHKDSLAEDDPLTILKNKGEAKDAFTRLGHIGSMDIKETIISGILKQKRAGGKKTIPASFVLLGKPGSGKSYLFEKLIEVVKLDKRYYDFNADEVDNLNAQVFSINMGNITDSSSNDQSLSINQLLEHFDKFFKLPNASRGFIFFDDIHLTSANVRGPLFSKIRSLFESHKGIFNGVPIRNVTLFMAFNPIEDPEVLKKWAQDYKNPTSIELAVATFNGEDKKVDASFFDRWGEIIQFDVFTPEAKGDDLINRFNEISIQKKSEGNGYVSLSSEVVSMIVKTFPNMGARSFLDTSLDSLENLIVQYEENVGVASPSLIIVPKHRVHKREFLPRIEKETKENLKDFIESHFTVVSTVDLNSTVGYILFTEQLMQTFRYSFIIEFINAFKQNMPLTTQFKQMYSVPTSKAIRSYLDYAPNRRIPVLFSNIEGKQLKDYNIIGPYSHINNDIASYTPEKVAKLFFPEDIFVNKNSDYREFRYLKGDLNFIDDELSRFESTTELSKNLESSLEEYMLRLLKLNQLSFNGEPITLDKLDRLYDHNNGFINGEEDPFRMWIRNMVDFNPKNQMDHVPIEFKNKIFSDFIAMITTFMDKDYIENQDLKRFGSLNQFELTLLYLYQLDNAITKMPWEKISLFVIKMLEEFNEHPALSNMRGSQFWQFKSKKMILRPITHEYIFELLKDNFSNAEFTEEKIEQDMKSFKEKLPNLFLKQ